MRRIVYLIAWISEFLLVSLGRYCPFMCEVDPVVYAEHRAIKIVLRVRQCKAGKYGVFNVSATIVVCVFEIQYMRCVCNEDALLPSHDAIRQGEMICEYNALIHHAITIGIGHQLDFS